MRPPGRPLPGLPATGAQAGITLLQGKVIHRPIISQGRLINPAITEVVPPGAAVHIGQERLAGQPIHSRAAVLLTGLHHPGHAAATVHRVPGPRVPATVHPEPGLQDPASVHPVLLRGRPVPVSVHRAEAGHPEA